MATFMSPRINITEIDLTTIIPSVSTTIGAFAGVFDWGPCDQAVLVTNEDQLVKEYGKPSANNAETWFTAANFLKYSNKLYISRAVSSNAYNAMVAANTPAAKQIKNLADFEVEEPTMNGDYLALAKYPGAKGNSLRLSICQSSNQFSRWMKSEDFANNTVRFRFVTGASYCNVIVTNVAANITHAIEQANTLRKQIVVNDVLTYGANYYDASNDTLVSIKRGAVNHFANVTSLGSITTVNSSTCYFRVGLSKKNIGYVNNTAANAWDSSRIHRQWAHAKLFSSKPKTTPSVAALGGSGDQMHVVVFDYDGAFTGVPGAILEKWTNLSRATDAKDDQGNDIYWQRVLNKSSEYVWAVNPVWGNPDVKSASITPTTDETPLVKDFTGGTDGANEANIAAGSLQVASDVFKIPEEIDVSILIAGKTKDGDFDQITNNLIEIAEDRKDCIVVSSPPKSYVVNNFTNPLAKVLEWRDGVNESSYAVLDSGYKYQYDKYNDRFWWVPLNGDIGGVIARTDLLRDPWWSPGGFIRGEIKGVVRLAWNPDQADRDMIYTEGVNPVITIAGEGTYLYGDKTAQARPSAFDRINVRRLFIVLEKAIAKAAKYTLFEFNDAFTRNQFRTMVEPYLRDIQGRRGIQDFRVVCDETNNTGEVIDRNEFRADIYIKPARSINYIQLNFVAVRSGVAFEEVVGKFG